MDSPERRADLWIQFNCGWTQINANPGGPLPTLSPADEANSHSFDGHGNLRRPFGWFGARDRFARRRKYQGIAAAMPYHRFGRAALPCRPNFPLNCWDGVPGTAAFTFCQHEPNSKPSTKPMNSTQPTARRPLHSVALREEVAETPTSVQRGNIQLPPTHGGRSTPYRSPRSDYFSGSHHTQFATGGSNQ